MASADLPEYQAVVAELHEQLRLHHSSFGCATAAADACCTTAACAAARMSREPGCIADGRACDCGPDEQSVKLGADYEEGGIIVANGTVAVWDRSGTSCDAVALVTPAADSFWVSVVAGHGSPFFLDIGLCSPSIAADGSPWAGHQKGKAFLYRADGQFADSWVTAPPPCGKGTACGQGVRYGKPIRVGANVTVVKRSATQLEFLLDGESQGLANTSQPMPADVVGCVSSCATGGPTKVSLASCQ